MLRHPIYLVMCLVAAGYLFLADSRGWSFFLAAANGIARARGGSGGSAFHHK